MNRFLEPLERPPRASPGDLTRRQRDILLYIVEHLEATGQSPTIRAIGARFDISSPNGIVCHIDALIRKGYLADDSRRIGRGSNGSHRGLRLAGATFRVQCDDTPQGRRLAELLRLGPPGDGVP